MAVLICGSLAFDTIMTFEGRFADQILAEQLHILNVSFLVPSLRRDFGGCAGNIAYSLNLLGGKALPMATLGSDGADYLQRLEALGIGTRFVRRVDDAYTAQAMIMTDMDNNQITAFHPGAMMQAHGNPIDQDSAHGIRLGIIAPDTAAWVRQPGLFTAGGARVREIFERGQALGNDPHAFSKVGDCNSELPFFLGRFDSGDYDLGPYAYLQPAIDYFAGSFGRQSVTVWTGSHAWSVLDPTWANPALCLPGETPLGCEFRLHRPSVVLIRLGTNEAYSPALFEQHMRAIIEYSIEQGVIPVLGTKADQLEGSDRINDIVRQLAAEYEVPLWDFGRVASTVPGRGLREDGFHMTWYPLTYGDPRALQAGHPVHNLTALIALNTVWQGAMVGVG